jgi:hypothetical protein
VKAKLFYLIAALSLIILAAPCKVNAGPKISTSGYVRNFLVVSDSGNGAAFEALSRVRVKLNIVTSESSSLELAYELLPWLRDPGGILSDRSFANSSFFSYRVEDLGDNILDNQEKDFVLAQNLDRAFFTYTASGFDLFAGRQPVAFGSARVINPTDIIAPFTVNTIAKDELAGVDAVRVKTPLAEMGECDAGIVFGKDFHADESAAFVRIKTYLLKTDISLMTMVFKENILLGIDLARSIGGAGTWLEAAHTLADAAHDYRPGEDYFRLTAGADYSFTSRLYAFTEYHFNGAGAGTPSDYLNTVNEKAFTDGAVYLLARHYITPGLSFEITPLLIFSSQLLINMEDVSALLSPSIEWSVSQNIYAGLSAFIGIGSVSSDSERPDNEFGLYTDTYFASLSFYF